MRKVLVGCILFLFALFPMVSFAENLSLSFDIVFGELGLQVVNNSDYKYVSPFRRGCTVVFLLSTESGQLFSNKNWKFQPSSFPNGLFKSLPSKEQKEPTAIALTPIDLSDFSISGPYPQRPSDYSRLFIKGLVKDPQEGSGLILSSPIFGITMTRGRISNIQSISKSSIPREVDLSMNREIEIIYSEEKNNIYR